MDRSAVALSRATARLGRFDDLTDDVQQLTAGLDLSAAGARYRRLRAAGRDVASRMMKHLDRPCIEASARRLGLWRRGTVVFAAESETAVLSDHMLFAHTVDGENAIARFRRESPPAPGTDDDAWFEAAVQARYAMWLVTGAAPGFGIAVRDLFSGEAVLAADTGFSHTAVPGLVLAGRMLPAGEFWFSSGAMLPVADERVLIRIGQYLERTCKRVRDLRAMDPQQALLVESFITRTCLEAGCGERIQHLM